MTDYSAIPALVTTETTKETDWDSLERIWKGLQKSSEDAPEWTNFWKSLDDWARDNINQDTLPTPDWPRMQVAAWARKLLRFDDEDAAALITAEVNGELLLVYVSKGEDYLLSEFDKAIPRPVLRELWAEMKNSLAEPDVTSTFSQMSTSLKKEKMSYEEIMASSVKKRTQNLLHEDWLSTNSHSDLCQKVYQWLQKYFIGNTAHALFTDDSLNTQGQPLVHEGAANVQNELPLRQRDEVLSLIETFLEARKTNFKESDKVKHQFFMLLGGSGIGKTRMARELQGLAKTHLPDQCKFRTAWIDFMNGQTLCSLDSQIKSPSAILGIRLLCTLLLQGMPTERFYLKMEKLCDTEWVSSLLEFFTVDVVMNLVKIHFHDNQCMVLIVMDEINQLMLTLGQNKVKDALGSLASFICTSYKATTLDTPSAAQLNQIILPVICGTITTGILDAVKVSGFGRIEPSLQYLSKESIEFIYNKYFSGQSQLTYLKYETFRRLLFYYGTLPRSLEYFLKVVSKQNHSSISDAIKETANQIDAALNLWIQAKSFNDALTSSHAKEFLSLILSGHGERGITNDKLQGLVRKAEQAGLAYYNGEELTLSPWQLQELVKATSLIRLSLLPPPNQPFFWQHFEMLEQELERVRVRSWQILKHNKIKVAEFLRGAKFENIGVFTQEMHLPPDQYINEEDSQFILVKPSEVNFTHTECSEITIPLMGSILKCKTNNPLVDIRSVYSSPGGKPIMIVKQMKHSQKGSEETVPWVEISQWFKATQKKMTQLRYNDHYNIVYVFITNRRITNMPKTIELGLAVVCAENLVQYFGQSVALLAQLVLPKRD